MPFETRLLIKTSFIYLIAGFTVGGLLLVNKGYPFWPSLWQLLPAHIEWLLLGWIVQFTMGTAYWIFPRFMEGSPRGNPRWVQVAYVLLNVGIVMVTAQATLSSTINLGLIGRVFEVLAVLLFILLHWRRVVTYRNSHAH